MGKAVGRHATLGQAVVADCGSSGDPFVDITLVKLVLVLGVMAPDAGIAIRLQFHSHRQRIRIAAAALLLGLRDLTIHAKQVLDVVPDLVCDHIGLGEVARRTETLIQFAEETAMIVTQVTIRVVQLAQDFMSVGAQIIGMAKAILTLDIDGFKAAWKQGNTEVAAYAMAATDAIEEANRRASDRVAKMWSESHSAGTPGAAKPGGTRSWVAPPKPETGGNEPGRCARVD